MKKLLPLLLFLFTAISSTAQTEIVYPYNNEQQSIENVCHVVDSEGNVYLLSGLYEAILLPGTPFDDVYCYGSLLTKIDKQNAIVWQRPYPTAQTPDAEMSYYNEMPANNMYMSGKSLIIPYSIYMGYTSCNNPNSASLTINNAMLIANKNNGDTILNKIFTDDGCGEDITLLNNGRYSDSEIAYLYYNREMDFFLKIKDITGNTILQKKADSLGYALNYSVYYPNQKQWVSIDNGRLLVYDSLANIIIKRPLPKSFSKSYVVPIKVAANSNYYIANYLETIDTFSQYDLAVFSSSGNLISFSKSKLFNDLTIAPDNQIWGVSTLPLSTTADTTPVTLMQMDLFQNVKRMVHIGKPFVIASDMTVTDSEVIITGTSFTTSATNPNKTPDRLYLYRQSISDIPLVHQPFTQCKDITMYPNPVSGTLSLSSRDFNSTHNASVSLLNAVGQQLGFYTWQQQKLDINMSSYPAGIYVVHISNPAAHKDCVQKIIKE